MEEPRDSEAIFVPVSDGGYANSADLNLNDGVVWVPTGQKQLQIKEGPRGRGVFAAEPIKKGDIVEIAPILEIPCNDYEHLKKTVLEHYVCIRSLHSC